MKRINGSKRRKSANLTTHNPQLTTNQGFTLIELLVASAIMVILAGGFVGLQYLLSTNQTSAWQSYLNIESANGALTSLTNELRNAQPSALGSYQLVTANDQEIIFYSDFDYDGVIEQVRYTLTGTNLERGTIKPSGNPLTYNVADEKIKTVTDIVRNGTNPIFIITIPPGRQTLQTIPWYLPVEFPIPGRLR